MEVVRASAGIQAQEPRSGRLQVRARSKGLTAGDVEAARVDDRSILRVWVMRMTAHVVPTEDLAWLAPIYFERIARWSRRRLDSMGLEDKGQRKALEAIRKKVRSDGYVKRGEAMAAVERAGIDVDIQRRTHLSVLAVTGGWACIGPTVGSESVFVDTREWIGGVRHRGRDESLTELARRYFAAFAPATDRDFASWSGLPLGDCRSAIESIAGELRTAMKIGDDDALAPKGWTARKPASPVVKLLGAYDTYLMGFDSREHAVGPEGEKKILPGGGVLRPTICVDGRFAGTWSSKRSGAKLTVTLEPFGELDPAWDEALRAEVADIGRFEGAEGVLA